MSPAIEVDSQACGCASASWRICEMCGTWSAVVLGRGGAAAERQRATAWTSVAAPPRVVRSRTVGGRELPRLAMAAQRAMAGKIFPFTYSSLKDCY